MCLENFSIRSTPLGLHLPVTPKIKYPAHIYYLSMQKFRFGYYCDNFIPFFWVFSSRTLMWVVSFTTRFFFRVMIADDFFFPFLCAKSWEGCPECQVNQINNERHLPFHSKCKGWAKLQKNVETRSSLYYEYTRLTTKVSRAKNKVHFHCHSFC